MKIVRRFFALFRDSPTYGRDQASLLSGFTVGSVALLLNAAVLMAVLPVMLQPDDRDFRQLTQHLEFGQLLSLILLGGAAVIATLVIPLRLISVFWGPRMGRYFDQIVLSGISPMRFVIGKVTSQNLFLGLILFLLVPYAVLALSLGGVKPVVFLACLVLVWIYCFTLAMVTLWLSLYLNELLSAVIVIVVASWLGGIGCIPFPLSLNPCIITPFPALMQPIWNVVYAGTGYTMDFLSGFLACAAGMSAVTVVAFAGIYLGPLYGIIRDNSTFGEVVKAGDATRKRWFRLRHHIQRPSELAFFYENRSETFRRHEGAIRWGTWFVALTTLLAIATGLRWYGFTWMSGQFNGDDIHGQFSYAFHVVGLVIHGVAVVLAIYVFSHSRNTTFQPIPVAFGRTFEVSRLDTVSFVLFTLVSTTIAIGVPFLFEHYSADHNNITVFHSGRVSRYYNVEIEFVRVAVEGTIVLTVCGICTYAMQRWLCLSSWIKIVPFFIVSALYGVLVCGSCLVPTIFVHEFRELQQIKWLTGAAPEIALASPVVVLGNLFGEFGPRQNIPIDPVFAAFYLLHFAIFIGCLLLYRRQSRILRADYLVLPTSTSKQPAEHSPAAAVQPAVTPAEAQA